MVVAKTEAAMASPAGQFKGRRVKKSYLALVHGEVKQTGARIATEIGRHDRDRRRMAVGTRKGREAVTTYRVMKRLDGFTLLQVHPETGRTHQIRVHLSAIGHAVVGDKVYGGRREKRCGVRGAGLERSGNCCMRGSSASSTPGPMNGWSSRPRSRQTLRAGFTQNRQRTPQQKQGYSEVLAWVPPERPGSRSRLNHFLLISFHHSPHRR
jgi:hypothetical protein